MPAELNNLEPEVGAQPEGEVVGAHGEPDREGAMAKADLFKLANYAHKLYQQIQDEDQLESWVQAKITKAADYVASVYHYLEYEMKFNEYGKHLDDADTLNESQKAAIKSRLMEAKSKLSQLKKAQAEKSKDKTKVDENRLADHEETCTECGGTGVITVAGRTVHPDHAGKVEKYKKLRNAVKAIHNTHAADLEVGESWDPDYDADDDADVKKADSELKKHHIKLPKVKHKEVPVKKTAKDREEEKDLDESAPSAGLSKAKKSETVKKAKAGGDIGKPGKNFDKVADKAAKKYGSKEKGEKVAAAAMWKNIKEETAYIEEKKAATKEKPDYIDLDKDGDKTEPMKKAAKEAKKETVKESADFTRMQEQMARLNRNENIQVTESSDADAIRKLTQRLFG
mgnify:FL=1